MALSPVEITARIKAGRNFMARFVANDRQACGKFRDPSNTDAYSLSDPDLDENAEGDVPEDMPVGLPNHLTVNILTKAAAITIGNPDFHVVADDEQAREVGRKFLRTVWREYDFSKPARFAFIKRCISAQGFVNYRWDTEKGACWHHVQSWDLAVDPNVTDWQRLDWAAMRVKMSLRKAVEKYGKGAFDGIEDSGKPGSKDTKRVEIWVYWDKETEAHVFGEKILNKDTVNHYGEVPIGVLEGDFDPNPTPFRLGDGQLAAGIAAGLSDLDENIFNTAKHGGPVNLYSNKLVDQATRNAISDGKQQGWIAVKDYPEKGFLRIPAEDVGDATLQAKDNLQKSLDAITGVTALQRGIPDQEYKFATEAALAAQFSGARGNQARIEYEKFVNWMAWKTIQLTILFGGPQIDEETQQVVVTDEQQILWEDLQKIEEVFVIEQTTTYKDPAFEQQNAMQVFELLMAQYPTMVQAFQMGTMTRLPNIEKYVDDINRARGKFYVDEYWVTPPPMMPMLPPGGDPGAEEAPVDETGQPLPPEAQDPNALPPQAQEMLTRSGVA